MNSRWSLPLALLLPILLNGCDLLLAPAAETEATATLSFAMEDLPTGDAGTAFDKADRVYLLFTRPDSVRRDTILPLARSGSLARVRLTLDAEERVEALGIFAELRAGPLPLFEGLTVVRIALGEPTSAEIPLAPIPTYLAASPRSLTMVVGDTARLSSSLLFATRDTIATNLATWSSDNGFVAAVTPAGLVLGVSAGETFLRVELQELMDSVSVRVTSF